MARTSRQKAALRALNYDLFEPERLQSPAPATMYSRIEQASAPCREPAVVELPRPWSGKLPTISELYRLFDTYNWMYFRGQLPRVSIEYSGRMSSAGSFTPDRRLIRIGRKYHELFPDEIHDTLKHEMIHIRHLHHDAGFKQEAARIGASVRARSHPALRKPPRYIYVCPGCGREYPRQKRLRMASCGYCSKGGEYDERYKLRLKRRR
jgi:predicted SprT family Zn-dependent metalloprotease